MNTWRETILQTIVTALLAANVASGRVFRSRTEALAANELPALVVKPGHEAVENTTRGLAVRRFEISLEAYASGEPADRPADEVLALSVVTLMTDDTLGGIIARLEETETSQPELADGNGSTTRITATMTAIYATPTGDPTRLA